MEFIIILVLLFFNFLALRRYVRQARAEHLTSLIGEIPYPTHEALMSKNDFIIAQARGQIKSISPYIYLEPHMQYLLKNGFYPYFKQNALSIYRSLILSKDAIQNDEKLKHQEEIMEKIINELFINKKSKEKHEIR